MQIICSVNVFLSGSFCEPLIFCRTFAAVMDNEFKYTYLPLSKLEVNKGQIEGVPENPRFIRDEKYRKLVKSIADTPEMMTARPLIVHQLGEKYVVLGGNMRLRAMRELKWKQSPCTITPEDAPSEKLREYAIKDNLEYGEDDMDILANNWDLDELKEWGMDFAWDKPQKDVHDRSEWKDGEANEEYDEFVDKFKPKLTTDDCYTPPAVYDVVLQWAKEKYHIGEQTTIVRPFFPGGDFERYDYPEDCVVIDNPPFSIMAKIMDWYQEHGIRFVLFCDQRTGACSAVRREGVTFISTDAGVIYENGAVVNTAFVTNMSPELMVHTEPELKAKIEDANKTTQEKRKIKHHPNSVVVARMIAVSKVPFSVKRSEIVLFAKCSKTVKDIFGMIGLVSDSKARELKEAERKARELKEAERKEAEAYDLEPLDYELIAKLNEREANQ